MLHLAGLIEELERSAPARDAMALLEAALARRSLEERGAFWRAVDIYYVSRKAPPEGAAVALDAAAASDPLEAAGLAP